KRSNCEDNRKCMVWDENFQDKELYSFVKKIIQIRKENNQFQNTFIEWILNDGDILVLKKENILLLINLNEEFDININLNDFNSKKSFKNLFTNEIIFIDEKKIKIENKGFLLLKNI
ncbi:MAG: hypothetical protein ACRC5W_07345, partial [Cetobacterium sp.]